MAIINSAAIGKATKSLGVITYREIRSQVIASQRITVNRSHTDKQVKHRNAFGEMSKIVHFFHPLILIGFKKTTHGSEYNNFRATNTAVQHHIAQISVFDKDELPLDFVIDALQSSDFKTPILIAKGAYDAYTRFAWDNTGQPVGKIELARPFLPGDTITIPVALSFDEDHIRLQKLRTYIKTLTPEDIQALPAPDTFTISNGTIPGFNNFDHLDGKTDNVAIVLVAIVTPPEDKPNAGSSTSRLILMPPLPYSFTGIQSSVGKTSCSYKPPDHQTFKQFLYPRALGAQIIIDGTFAPVTCPVKGFYPDPALSPASDYTPIGLPFDPPAGRLFATPLEGNPAPVAPLVKDGDTIALLSPSSNPKPP
ncbi:hypothetical protein Barb6_03296 [Bacteroidales bacterium Barb6]|nr:hypothetical protein Barb6_03296 [Bacteroidales bacterium Barb6]